MPDGAYAKIRRSKKRVSWRMAIPAYIGSPILQNKTKIVKKSRRKGVGMR